MALPVVPVAQAEQETDWTVAPLAAGDWRYAQDGDGTIARFGGADAPALLSFRCHPRTHEIVITLNRAGARPGTMTLRTSAGELRWPAAAAPDGSAAIVVTRTAGDPGFDWIAYSRGRFAVEAAGLPQLVVPAWAEVVRVIEDCRG